MSANDVHKRHRVSCSYKPYRDHVSCSYKPYRDHVSCAFKRPRNAKFYIESNNFVQTMCTNAIASLALTKPTVIMSRSLPSATGERKPCIELRISCVWLSLQHERKLNSFTAFTTSFLDCKCFKLYVSNSCSAAGLERTSTCVFSSFL